MGVICEAGDAHSSGAPDFTFQWRVYVVSLLFTDFDFVQWTCAFGFVCHDTNRFYCGDEATMLLYLNFTRQMSYWSIVQT